MKKLLIFLLCISLFVTVPSCKKEETHDESDCGGMRTKAYQIEYFKEHINDTNDPIIAFGDRVFNPDAFVDLNSIIPDGEIVSLVPGTDTSLSIVYSHEDLIEQNSHEINFFNSFELTTRYINGHVEFEPIICEGKVEDSGIPNEYTINIDKEDGQYAFNINGTEVIYVVKDKWLQYVYFTLGDYQFGIYRISSPLRNGTDSQKAFAEAFMTEAGTAEMLDRIEALLPVQPDNDNTSEPEANSTGKSDADSDSGVKAAVSGSSESKVNDSIGEEYIPPKDPPVSQRILDRVSPGWLPNEDGRFPLKEAYTREELNMILAAEILLDIPKGEFIQINPENFPLIEKETEEESEEQPK